MYFLCFSLAAMTCVHPQHGSQLYDNSLGSSEPPSTDLISRLSVDKHDHVFTPALPSISSLVGGQGEDSDAYSCQFTAAPAHVPPPSGQEAALTLDAVQVYGCYPGPLMLGYSEELMSPCGSEYFGSSTSTSAPSTPGFQSQHASSWDLAFGPYSPSPGYWSAEDTLVPHTPSFFTFGPGSLEDVGQTPLRDQEPFTLAHPHSSAPTFSALSVDQGCSLEDTDQADESLSPKLKSPGGSEGCCAVCGDNASCQHYGVRTCEGCKGFFKVRESVSGRKKKCHLS